MYPVRCCPSLKQLAAAFSSYFVLQNKVMMRRQVVRELIAILMAIVFPALGIGIILISQKYLGLNIVNKDLVAIFLLLLPSIVYAISAGRLGEFKAAGVEAKFTAFAEQSTEWSSEKINLDEKMQLLTGKEDREIKLSLSDSDIDRTRPIVLTLMLGHVYKVDSCLTYVKSLSQYINFKFVVFLTPEEEVDSYTPARSMLQLLQDKDFIGIFIDAIKSADKRRLHMCPGVITKTITTKATNLDALKEMISQNLDALVVVKARKLAGVVEREQIISKLMLELAK